MNLIGINGYISSGKDTVGSIIQELTSDFNGYVAWDNGSLKRSRYPSEWFIKKYAYKLKQIASIMLGVPVEKFEDQDFKKTFLPDEWGYRTSKEINETTTEAFWTQMTVREFLQKLGTEAIRDGVHKNAWVNSLFADYKPESKWIITDCRFPNEAQGIKDRGGIVIRVNRTLAEAPYQTLEQRHPSETSLDDWKFDYVIQNDSTMEALRDEVAGVLECCGVTAVINS